MDLIQLVRDTVDLGQYGDSSNWLGIVEASEPEKANRTREIAELIFDGFPPSKVKLVSSLHASVSFKDWIEQVGLTKKQYLMLCEFQELGWIKFEDFYGNGRTSNQYNQYLDGLSYEESQEESRRNEKEAFDIDGMWECRIKDISLLKDLWVWCVDIGYLSGHIFFIFLELGLVFYPYYFENGFGIIYLNETGYRNGQKIFEKIRLYEEYQTVIKDRHYRKEH